MRYRLALWLLLLPISVAADDTVKGKSGEEVRLAVLGSIKADCSVNPSPTVNVRQPASHGVLRVVDARLKTKRFPKCIDVEIPVKVIFYKSSPDFKGEDKAIVEVSFKAGDASVRTFTISVE